MRESFENGFNNESYHDAVYLRGEIEQFQKGKPIGWKIKGDELRFVDAEDLEESDLDLFDQIEYQEISAGNMAPLEKAIKENFAGVDKKLNPSRFHFEAFLRSLLFNKWCAFVNEQRDRGQGNN